MPRSGHFFARKVTSLRSDCRRIISCYWFPCHTARNYALLKTRTAANNSVLQLRGKLNLIIKQKSGRVRVRWPRIATFHIRWLLEDCGTYQQVCLEHLVFTLTSYWSFVELKKLFFINFVHNFQMSLPGGAWCLVTVWSSNI